MLLLNLAIALLCLWLIVTINNKYLQPAIKNIERFKLYKLRDDLSILAMSSELDESSEEYVTLIALINSSIRATGSFKVTDFLRFVFFMHKDKEMHKKIERIMGNLKKTDNPKYCKIASEYFSVMHNILRRDTVVLRFAFFPLMIAIAALISLSKVSGRPQSIVNNKRRAIDSIDSELDDYSNQFGRMCTT